MRTTIIAAAAALALSSGAAMAAGVPPGLYESSQPHPRFSEAEIAASAHPFAWIGRLFQGEQQQTAGTQPPAGASAPSSTKG